MQAETFCFNYNTFVFFIEIYDLQQEIQFKALRSFDGKSL